jgi:hypothetical protein
LQTTGILKNLADNWKGWEGLQKWTGQILFNIAPGELDRIANEVSRFFEITA